MFLLCEKFQTVSKQDRPYKSRAGNLMTSKYKVSRIDENLYNRDRAEGGARGALAPPLLCK